METYCIVRHYAARGKPNEIIKRGLTRDEAMAWCQRDDSRLAGVWFDGFTLEA
jgi:hypothetical protein